MGVSRIQSNAHILQRLATTSQTSPNGMHRTALRCKLTAVDAHRCGSCSQDRIIIDNVLQKSVSSWLPFLRPPVAPIQPLIESDKIETSALQFFLPNHAIDWAQHLCHVLLLSSNGDRTSKTHPVDGVFHFGYPTGQTSIHFMQKGGSPDRRLMYISLNVLSKISCFFFS